MLQNISDVALPSMTEKVAWQHFAKKFEFALRASSTFSFRTVFGFWKKGKEMTRVYLLPCKDNPSKALLTERKGKMTQPGACKLSYQGLS